MTENQYPFLSLTIQDLACVRGERLLFEHFSLQVKSGELVQIRGANGIGKSSLLRLIAGLAAATCGEIRLSAPQEPEDEPYFPADYMHFLAHKNALKDGLTVLENLVFWHQFCEEKGVTPATALDFLAVPHLKNLPVSVLSAGQRRRVAFARLLVARRPVWLLDEPTAALDSNGDALVGGLMADHLKKGGMVLAATHLPLKIDDKAGLIKTFELNHYQPKAAAL